MADDQSKGVSYEPKLTPEFYRQLCDAFFETRGSPLEAAKLVGCSRQTASKAWNHGWLDVSPEYVPIRERVEQGLARAERVNQSMDETLGWPAEVEELAVQLGVLDLLETPLRDKVRSMLGELRVARAARSEVAQANKARMAEVDQQARAILQKAEDAAQERLRQVEEQAKARFAQMMDLAKVDAVEVQADLAQGSKLSRQVARAQLAFAAGYLRHAQKLQAIVDRGIDGLKPREALTAARTMQQMAESAVHTWETAMRSELLAAGKPTEIVGITVDGGQQSIEDEEHIHAAFGRSIERRKAREAAERSAGAVLAVPAADGAIGTTH